MSDDPFAAAIEHIAWCLGQGISLAEVFECLDAPYRRHRISLPGRRKTWNDAVAMVAAEHERCAAVSAGRRVA